MNDTYKVKIPIIKWDGDFIKLDHHLLEGTYQVHETASPPFSTYINTEELGTLDVSDRHVSYTEYR